MVLSALVAQLALGALVGEVAIRLYARLNSDAGRMLTEYDPMAVSIIPHGRFGYRQRPHSAFHYANGTTATSNALGYRGPPVAVPKPPGTYRILLLGESTTHGWGVNDDETIDAYMRRLLAEHYAGQRFDVVNLALDGYDSHQLVERLRTDGVRLAPDLVIVNSGINDVRNARYADLKDPDPRTQLWEDVLQRLRGEERRGRPTLWTSIKHYSYVARLPSIARHYWQRQRSTEDRQKIVPNLAAADIFEQHLERICTLAEQMGVPVVLSTPPSSLRLRYALDRTSDRDYWINDAATTQRLRDELAGRMRRVVERRINSGRDVKYVAHEIPGEMFLDDAHLTARGNLQMASDFVVAVSAYVEKRLKIGVVSSRVDRS